MFIKGLRLSQIFQVFSVVRHPVVWSRCAWTSWTCSWARWRAAPATPTTGSSSPWAPTRCQLLHFLAPAPAAGGSDPCLLSVRGGGSGGGGGAPVHRPAPPLHPPRPRLLQLTPGGRGSLRPARPQGRCRVGLCSKQTLRK